MPIFTLTGSVKDSQQNIVTATVPINVQAATTVPEMVGDLTVVSTTPNSATLSFTEVNDGTGQPASYDIRYAVSPISWGSATNVTQGTGTVPVIGTIIGTKRICTVLGLLPNTNYQFQLVAFRGTLNLSAVFSSLSNIVGATTSSVTTPPLPSSKWPNEPTGGTLLADWGFDVPPPSTATDQPIPGSNGWNIISNGFQGAPGSGVRLVVDTTSPVSPPSVYQFTYKAGFPAGVGPGNVYRGLGKSRVYVGFWWRMSNPWTTTTAAQKLLYLMDGASNWVLDMQNTSDPFVLRWVIDGIQYLQTDGGSGPAHGPAYALHPGHWYRIELLADAIAHTIAYWITEVGESSPTALGTAIVANSTSSFTELQVSPTYGGNGTPAAQDQYFQYDHIRVSGN